MRDCKDIQDTGNHHGDGMYRLDLSQQGTTVKCDMTTDGGGWTVITYIYILNVAALDKTIIPSCLHFSMQNIGQSRGLGRASR